ncbi:MAG: RNA degradosome polyphosphate kinase, partial [Mesorhizobium sp.]
MNELKPVHSEFITIEAASAESGNPDRFVNREFSWLQFNRRVLEESLNPHHPLLERIRFLSISAGNLDEFFMVRVAGLAGQVREGIVLKSPDGRTPEQQLEQLLREVERLQEDQQKSLSTLMQLLNKEGIESITRDALTKDEKAWLEEHFQDQVFPVLTPLSIDPAHPFPFIPNLGFSMALQLRHRKNGEEMSALLRLPVALKRFIRLPDRKNHVRFIPLEEAVGLYIGKLFPGYEVKGSGTFR